MCFLCVNRKVGGLGILQECQLHCDKNFDWKSYDFPYYHQGIMNITWNIPINGNSKILLFRSELFKYALSNPCIIHIFFILIIFETATQKCLFPS